MYFYVINPGSTYEEKTLFSANLRQQDNNIDAFLSHLIKVLNIPTRPVNYKQISISQYSSRHSKIFEKMSLVSRLVTVCGRCLYPFIFTSSSPYLHTNLLLDLSSLPSIDIKRQNTNVKTIFKSSLV